jgi:hypothetical protein
MKEKDVTMMSIAEVSSMIKNKQISPVEIIEECIRRTKVLQPKLNAYITFLEDEAKKNAKVAEQEVMKKGPKSPLHGIPIALKDLFYTKRILTSAASQLRYCQMLWMDKFTSFGTLTATPLYPPALHPGISCSPGQVESFDIPEAAASLGIFFNPLFLRSRSISRQAILLSR